MRPDRVVASAVAKFALRTIHIPQFFPFFQSCALGFDAISDDHQPSAPHGRLGLVCLHHRSSSVYWPNLLAPAQTIKKRDHL